MAEFIVSRDIATYSTQRVLVTAETEEQALRLSEEDNAEALVIIDEEKTYTCEITNNEIQTPEAAFQDLETYFSHFPEEIAFEYGGRKFHGKAHALKFYRERFHLVQA